MSTSTNYNTTSATRGPRKRLASVAENSQTPGNLADDQPFYKRARHDSRSSDDENMPPHRTAASAAGVVLPPIAFPPVKIAAPAFPPLPLALHESQNVALPELTEDVDEYPEPIPMLAKAPFDGPPKDDTVVIRCSDDIDFLCSRKLVSASSIILSVGSVVSVFGGTSTEEKRDGMLVFRLAESHPVVDGLLRFLTPRCTPVYGSSEVFMQIVTAMRRYHITGVRSEVEVRFKVIASREPLKQYAAACQFRWKDGMLIAAVATLGITVNFSAVATFNETAQYPLIAEDALRLTMFKEACGDAARALLLGPDMPEQRVATEITMPWLDNGKFSWNLCVRSCRYLARGKRNKFEEITIRRGEKTNAPLWFTFYICKVAKRLRLKPVKATILHADTTAEFASTAKKHCERCAERMIADWDVFAAALANHLERAISKVRPFARHSPCLAALTKSCACPLSRFLWTSPTTNPCPLTSQTKPQVSVGAKVSAVIAASR